MASGNPIEHTLDLDAFHFPGGHHFDVYQWTHSWMGDALGFVGIRGLTKFMTIELLAATLCFLVLIPYARGIKKRGYAKGVFSNLIESVITYMKDKVIVPAIGEHDAHMFLPYLLTIFFFVLFCNLLGMVPLLGTPTGALGCTIALALCSFFAIHAGGVAKMGGVHYAKSIVPHVPGFLYPLMLVVEIVGHVVRPSVLAFRLFVNMVAGHTVLFVFLSFIQQIGDSFLYWLVTPASLMGVLALSFLELFVAMLHAFLFTFLSAIFIGSAVHPHH